MKKVKRKQSSTSKEPSSGNAQFNDAVGSHVSMLFDCKLVQQNVTKDKDALQKGVKREYAIVKTYRPLGDDENFKTYVCDFAAQAKTEGNLRYSFKATYVVALKCEGKKESSPKFSTDDIAEYVIRHSVWPRYRDLFATIASQTGIEMPALPRLIPEIKREDIKAKVEKGRTAVAAEGEQKS